MCMVAYFTEVTKSRSLPRRAEWEDDTCSDEQGDIGATEKMQGMGAWRTGAGTLPRRPT